MQAEATETTETTDYSRSFWRRTKISLLAWCGIEIKDKDGFHDIDQSLFVLRPELVVRDLKIVDLANDINLHSEIESGECCCGLILEFAGMPLEAQIGHVFRDEPTSLIMLDSSTGIKQHCQTCNRDFLAFTTECEHASTREPVYCHRCFQDHIVAVREHGCDGHNFAEVEETASANQRSIFSQIFEKAEPGGWIFTGVSLGTLLIANLNFRVIVPAIWPLISHAWFNMALIGTALWMLAIYRDGEPARSAKLKERAVGVFILAGFGMAIPGVLDQFLYVVDWVLSGFGITW